MGMAVRLNISLYVCHTILPGMNFPPCRMRVLRPGILIHLEVMTHLIDDPVDFHFLRTAVVSCSLVDREIIASAFHLRQFWVHVACQPRNRVSNARLVDKVVLDHL